MTRRSPLEVLRDLRARAAESEKARFATKVQEEAAAAATADQARSALLGARRERELARDAENRRASEHPSTAADGTRRAAWERAQREREALLGAELERAIESHRSAVDEQQWALHSLERAEKQLEQVQQRLDRAQRSRHARQEAAQQETLDEAAMRRHWEHGRA